MRVQIWESHTLPGTNTEVDDMAPWKTVFPLLTGGFYPLSIVSGRVFIWMACPNHDQQEPGRLRGVGATLGLSALQVLRKRPLA